MSPAPTLPLAGRSILITGGGTGIGAACAQRAALEGAAVTICGRTAETLEQSKGRIDEGLSQQPDGAGTVRTAVADVTVEADVERLVATTMEANGGLDGVVANAGGGGAIAPYHLQEVDEFVRVLHVNVVGTMLLVKHTVSHLVASGHGSFVGMSSVAGGLTHPYFGAYPVAKAGIETMMANAADEYGATGTRFNAVRPGFTATEIMEAIPRDSPVFASYLENTPMNGVAEPDDVARLVTFLLGPASRWITGEVVSVDGGHQLRRGPDFSAFIEPVWPRDVLEARRPPDAVS